MERDCGHAGVFGSGKRYRSAGVRKDDGDDDAVCMYGYDIHTYAFVYSADGFGDARRELSQGTVLGCCQRVYFQLILLAAQSSDIQADF